MASRRLLERRIRERKNTAAQVRDTSTWPTVNINVIENHEHRENCRRRVRAVTAYIETSRAASKIAAEAGFTVQELLRIVKRCLMLEEGDAARVVGFVACLQHSHVRGYTRDAEPRPADMRGHGMSGSFEQLLNRFPATDDKSKDGIRNFIRGQLLGRDTGTGVPERKKAISDAHNAFKSKLKALGVKANEYPFNTKHIARESFRRFACRLLDSELEAYTAARNLKFDKRVADPLKSIPPLWSQYPFDCLMLDGHKLDTTLTVGIPTAGGIIKSVPLSRLSIVGTQDKASRAFLSYSPVIAAEYSAEHVARALGNVCIPWAPRKLTIENLRYPPGAGLPSGVIPECAWVTWNRLEVDNALANLAKLVLESLDRHIGCIVNDGVARFPEGRAILERTFRTLESRVGHRLPSTHGSGPGDPRKTNPEAQAVKYDITIDDLLQVLDVEVARFNATPHSGINGMTPLEYLRAAFAQGHIVRHVPVDEQNGFTLNEIEIKRTVRGSVKNGVKPYIDYERVVYRNATLSNTASLIGVELTLRIKLDDLRFIEAFLPDGRNVGVLKASGDWGVWPHSMMIRKLLKARNPRGHLQFIDVQDSVEALLQDLAKRAQGKSNGKRAATKYAAIIADISQSKDRPVMFIRDDAHAAARMSASERNEARIKERGDWIELGETIIH